MHGRLPRIDPHLTPPAIHGTAALAHLAFAGEGLAGLLRRIARPAATPAEAAALLLDSAAAHFLSFRSERGRALEAEALTRARLFRVASPRPAALRLLALVAPGGPMVNTPLDFITRNLDVQLDLLFVGPDGALPDCVPEHDLAFFAVSESAPQVLERLVPFFRDWPRPALNDPRQVARLTRDGLAAAAARLPGCAAPEIAAVTRAEAARLTDFPLLLRPHGSHAGQDLARLDNEAGLAAYLAAVPGERFFACPFIDYRSADGLFRKYRVVLIGGAAHLCHMAVSGHWMVHYLNAGMTCESGKRDMEAQAMAAFATGFAQRHAMALAALDDLMGLDYCQIDCAELPDGRLLVFEADVAAIIHQMDPPDLFPYKAPHMQRVMAAFGALLHRRAADSVAMARV